MHYPLLAGVFGINQTRSHRMEMNLQRRSRRLLIIALAITAAGNAHAKSDPGKHSHQDLFGWAGDAAVGSAAPAEQMPSLAAPSGALLEHEARVISAVEAPGFNTMYLQLESSSKRFWIASRTADVTVGNVVRFSADQAVAMDNFESKALKRTFERIYFVPTIIVADGERGDLQ